MCHLLFSISILRNRTSSWHAGCIIDPVLGKAFDIMKPKPGKPGLVDVGDADFEPQVLQAKQPVVVAFWAPWSRPCQIFEAALDEVAVACAGRVKVVRINADDHPDLSMWYDIQSIPSLLIFVEGILRDKVVGTVSKEGILTKLRPLVPGLDSPAPPMASAIQPANAAIISIDLRRHHARK